jgi:hypothetical protein
MKKVVLNAALAITALALVGSSGRAVAATYDFSYVFVDNGSPAGTVTGQFTGTGPITDITGISNITMSLDGTPMAGPFYAWSYNPPPNVTGFPGNFTEDTAEVSSDPTANNFLFTNANSTSAPPGNYFYIIQPWDNPGPGSTTIATQLVNNGTTIDAYNGQYMTANWSLTAVPEPATWGMMLLGIGMIGGGMRMTRRNNAIAPGLA